MLMFGLQLDYQQRCSNLNTYTSCLRELIMLLLRHSRSLTIGPVVGNCLSTFLGRLNQIRLSRCLAASRRLAIRLPARRFLVCCNVEHDEENQIRAENNATRNRCVRVAGASAHVGEPREVRAGPVIPGRKIDNSCGRRILASYFGRACFTFTYRGRSRTGRFAAG